MKNEYTYEELLTMAPGFIRDEMKDIEEGKALPLLTFDAVFKKVFDPDVHQERVTKLFQYVFEVTDQKIISSLKTEHAKPLLFSKKTVNDLNARITDESILNMEMQVKAQEFIVNRINVYEADLNILQYSVAFNQKKKEFTFEDIRHTYMIVLMKESPSVFKGNKYFIHKKLEITDTGIELKRLSTVIYIELDKCLRYVREHGYLEGKEELCQYLIAMADTNCEETLQHAKINPDIAKILLEVEAMSHNKEDLMNMLSEKYADAIRISEIVESRKSALAEGRQDGFREGRQDGFRDGHQDGFRDGRQDGFREGHQDGFRDGQLQTKVMYIIKKMLKGKSVEIIADELEYEVEDVVPLVEKIRMYAPEYDIDKIVAELIKEEKPN